MFATNKDVQLAIVVCVLGVLAIPAFADLPKAINPDDVLFYASYDKADEAEIARGAAAPIVNPRKPKIVPGRAGQAMECPWDTIYPAAGNISRDAGTVAFWFCPRWDPQDKEHHRLFDWIGKSHAYDRILFYKYAHNNKIYFGTRSTKGSKAAQEPTCTHPTPGWKTGDWHHLIGTWDTAKAELHLYVDGKLAAKVQNRWEFGTMPPRITVGSKGTVVDEFMILRRPLSAKEVQALFATYSQDAGAR